MKPNRRPGITFISVFLLAALHPVSAIGGAKTYDLNVLLDKPHLFSRGYLSRSPEARSATEPERSTPVRKPPRNTALNSITVFGGVMTDNNWEDIFTPHEIEFRDAILLGIAAYRKIWQPTASLGVGIEGQVVRHFKDQDHWEFNFPIVTRWHNFPWDNWLDTSFAFGVGPSYASEVPREEVAREGDSHQFLIHWFAELEFGLPSSLWSGTFRLHHRSGGFGLISDEGGSNFITLGIRRQY